LPSKKGDTFANLAAVHPVESAAGTAAYAKFAFPFSIMDKMALIISRIEYFWEFMSRLDTTEDYFLTGIAVSNAVVDLTNQADPSVVDSARYVRNDFGTAGSAELEYMPYVKDFSALPGGGILVAPNPLYAFGVSNGASGVMGAWVRMYYTYIEMNADEYWQLVESRRIISS